MGQGELSEKKKKGPSCDWEGRRTKKGICHETKRPVSRVHRHRSDYSWSGVRTERYKSRAEGQDREGKTTWNRVLRRTLVGGLKGERTRFHLRYFEIAPGGNTSLERHRHEHVVICVRGQGICRAGEKTLALGFLDTAYIAPQEVHRLENPADNHEPFGFFCVVDARRDASVIVE